MLNVVRVFRGGRRRPSTARKAARQFPVAAFCDDARGASATEFALLAPLLALALLSATDLGLAEYQKMSMDHALRAAAQKAMSDPGAEAARQIASEAAAANFSAASGADSLTISARRFCACPDNLSVEVACTTSCANGRHTYIYYRLDASKNYVGFLLPTFSLRSSAQVQIR